MIIKKILFFSFFILSLNAESLILLDYNHGKLYFKDGSVYRLTRESNTRFPNEALGSTFEVDRIRKKERMGRYDTSIVNQHGSFRATQVAKKNDQRAIAILERYEEKKFALSKNPGKVFVTSIQDRILRLSDGSVFELQTTLPNRSLEGEEVSLEKVDYFQIKTAPGERVLLKMVKKPK